MTSDTRPRRNLFMRFLSLLWRSLKALNTLVFGVFSLLLITVIVVAFINQRDTEIPDGVALLVNPQGSLVEQQSALEAAALLQGSDLPRQTLLRDVTDAFERARDDERIALVVLALDGLDSGQLPMLEAIAESMTDFRRSGKSVIAMADNYSQSALYLAAHADEVLLNPEGLALPEGFAMYRTYFASLLEEQEVTVNLFKVGQYKSAVDPFVMDSMSEEDRTARQVILDGWWQSYTRAIETARGLSDGSINAMLQDAATQLQRVDGDLARLSLEKGLVDRLISDGERERYLIERAGKDPDSEGYRKVGYQHYLRDVREPIASDAEKVAVISAVGNILDGRAPAGQIGSRTMIERIRQARQDNTVKAIVVRIDSGGGSKSASEMIRRELQAAQADGLPVVVSMGAVAASGGYWIAATADEIWASPTTVTGSIGIFGLLPTFENTLARHGIYSDGVSTTPIAGGASLTRGVTPEFRAVLQTVIEAGYRQFLETVAQGRDMDVEAVDAIAQGRIWTGQDAQARGLVDALGGLDEAIDAAAELADLQDWSVWHVTPEPSMEEQILRRLAEVGIGDVMPATRDPLSRLMALGRREFAWLETLNDPRHAYLICADCLLRP